MEEERANRGIDSKLWEIVDNTEFKLFLGGETGVVIGSIYSSTPKSDSIETAGEAICFIIIAIVVILWLYIYFAYFP